MKIQTVYKDGVFRPVKPLRLKRQMVTISIPDEDIVEDVPLESREAVFDRYKLSSEVRASAEKMLAELESIRNAAHPTDEELPPLTEKQKERFGAFSLREDR